jgi:hypothetical protein
MKESVAHRAATGTALLFFAWGLVMTILYVRQLDTEDDVAPVSIARIKEVPKDWQESGGIVNKDSLQITFNTLIYYLDAHDIEFQLPQARLNGSEIKIAEKDRAHFVRNVIPELRKRSIYHQGVTLNKVDDSAFHMFGDHYTFVTVRLVKE